MVELTTSPISAVALTATNLHLCEALWPDRATFTGATFASAMHAARRLIESQRARGALILEGRAPRGYGLTVFVDAAFADSYLASPHPQIGKRLLLQPPPGVILDRSRIADANAGGGLHVVVVSTQYDAASPDVRAVLGHIMQAFLDVHRGFRITRVINEVIGRPIIEVVTRGGSYEMVRIFDEIAPGTGLPSAVGVMTRERASMPVLPLFAYNPPRVRFTPAEQEVLRAALDGSPDDAISVRLGLPLTSIKARWTRIHQRVGSRAPDLIRPAGGGNLTPRRGPQTRHLILAYVRQHPSELTPYPRQD